MGAVSISIIKSDLSYGQMLCKKNDKTMDQHNNAIHFPLSFFLSSYHFALGVTL